MRSILATAVVFAMSLSFGCSSSRGGGPGAPKMSWLDDGVPTTPFGADATLTSSGGRDSYRIDGLTTGPGSVTILLAAPTPIAAQAFDCNQLATGQTVTVSHANGSGFDVTDESCKVVITQAGVPGGLPLVGTFEAVIKLTPDGTKILSNGVFNMAVLM